MALGPVGGAILGGVFGITSCLQCVGIGGTSAMGRVLLEISPILTILQPIIVEKDLLLKGLNIIYKKNKK